MAVIEATGLQQVLSLSNVAEKLQQTSQQRPDQIHNNFVSEVNEQDQLKKNDVPISNKSDESRLREDMGKGGVKYKHTPRRKKKPKEEKKENDATQNPLAGKFVDITV